MSGRSEAVMGLIVRLVVGLVVAGAALADGYLIVQGRPQAAPEAPCCSLLMANGGSEPVSFEAGPPSPWIEADRRSGTLWPGQQIVLNVYAVPGEKSEPLWAMVWQLEQPAPGDLDRDGDVDLADMATFGSCYGLNRPNQNCPAWSFRGADLDLDGRVRLSDFATMALLYGGG